jgi:hypothetical protein
MSTISATAFGVRPEPEIIRAFAEAGAERVICILPPRPEAGVLPVLDRFAAVAREFEVLPKI